MKNNKTFKKYVVDLILILLIIVILAGCNINIDEEEKYPLYDGTLVIILNDNKPNFNTKNLDASPYETYSDLDFLGRCGIAEACVGLETMPVENETRGDISFIHPTGWKQNKYDFIEEEYLYNRCHLIAWCLSAENANEKNLITGTQNFNVYGMMPYEVLIANYIEETKNHVMYRVTPYFKGTELLARGVQVEAYSIEDNGEGICFNVFIFNVQDNVDINYRNGSNKSTILEKNKVGQTVKANISTTKAVDENAENVTTSSNKKISHNEVVVTGQTVTEIITKEEPTINETDYNIWCSVTNELQKKIAYMGFEGKVVDGMTEKDFTRDFYDEIEKLTNGKIQIINKDENYYLSFEIEGGKAVNIKYIYNGIKNVY